MTKPKIINESNILISEFKLRFDENSKCLAEWLNNDNLSRISKFDDEVLAEIEPHLNIKIDGWLEEELKMKVLSIIFFLAKISEFEKIDVFYERLIAAEMDNVSIKVVTDCMISSVLGFSAPQKPYFFMQEFKKTRGDKQDPEGQMLAAMLAGQKLNDNGKPMYGSYVIGRDWFFSTLDGKNYAKSEAFRLTQPKELRQIILTLRKLKQIILNDLMT